MISLADALLLHWRKSRRKRLFRSGRQFILLFVNFFLVLAVFNLVWGAGRLAKRWTRDPVYPHASLLVVEKLKRGKQIGRADLRRIAGLDGVAAVQEGFSSSGQHYFGLGEVQYPVPTSILGYCPEIFHLYDVIDPKRRDPAAIPMLLSEDLLALRHDPGAHRFVRADAKARDRLLGKVFSVWVDPLLGQRPLRFSWKEDTALLENPAAQLEKVRSLHQKVLETTLQEQPGMFRYLVPLELRVQVVGFARERLYADASLRGYGIVPLDVAKQVREFVFSRRNGGHYTEEEPDEFPEIYVVPAPGRAADVAGRIRALGFDPLDREGYNRKRTDWVEDMVHEIRRDWEGYATVSSLLLGFWLLLLYLAVSSVTKESVAEIGVLRALGARRRDLVKIYLVAGAVEVVRAFVMAAVAVNALLLAAGVFTSRLFTTIPAASIETGVFTGEVLRLGSIPSTWLLAPLWGQALLLALFAPLTLLAAWLPVRKASRVDPVTAIAG